MNCNIMWFRRDLRVNDNHALSLALKQGNVLPVFIFDTDILSLLESSDQRIGFIHREVTRLSEEISAKGGALQVYQGKPVEVFRELLLKFRVDSVFCNNDHEPYALKRDEAVKKLCESSGIIFETVKDHLIFERNEIVKPDGKPYTVFTPYSKKWKTVFESIELPSYKSGGKQYAKAPVKNIPTLKALGFSSPVVEYPGRTIPAGIITSYAKQRDYPGINGTSRLGIHLRFGTVSIRDIIRQPDSSGTFQNELIWREFYQAILWHFPHVVNHAFKPAYDNIQWRNNEKEFERWCEGNTGYPIVDAGMRELNETGFMHNRVRMITASFLCKHLLIDWRWGESYFASRLLDYELASNNGGWQWAAGSGCDAAPYFRIFNPTLQTKKFDPQLKYTRKWVPELDSLSYPQPMVDHEFARKRCIEVYREALKTQ